MYVALISIFEGRELLSDAGVPIDKSQRNCGDAAIEALLRAK